MRLPQHLVEDIGFCVNEIEQFEKGLLDKTYGEFSGDINRLWSKGLPPVVNEEILSFMTGLHPRFIWSLVNKTNRYYRTFSISKGNRGSRVIQAPKVALKVIQKWLSIHLGKVWLPMPHVHGFIKGFSHLTAAKVHTNAKWVFSVDIKNFFTTTPLAMVQDALRKLGYDSDESVRILSLLITKDGVLPQGAPSSPLLSNICFAAMDEQLKKISDKFGCRLTRYADDIVFSGNSDEFPTELKTLIMDLFSSSVWEVNQRKVELSCLPNRLKVHGLLVHGENIRLTKGYRNKLRLYKYLVDNQKARENDLSRLSGHIKYQLMVDSFSKL